MIALGANGDVGDVYLRVLRKGEECLRAHDGLAVDAGRRQKSCQGIRNLRIEIRGPVRYRQAVQYIGRYGIERQLYRQLMGDVTDIRRIGQETPAQLSLESERELVRARQGTIEEL